MKKSRFFSFLAAAALAVTTLGTAGFGAAAADGDPVEPVEHSITITKKDNEAHTFEAYQLFTGNLENKAITEITWGANVNKEKLLEVLQGTEVTIGEGPAKFTAPADITALFEPITDFTDTDGNLDATKVANAISNNASDNSDIAKAFADVFNAVLTGTPAGSTTVPAGTETTIGTISNLATGYYLIKDEENSQANKEGAYTDFILKLVEDVNIASKSEAPTITKKIVENAGKTDEALVDATTASIGDTVNYQLDSKVPDMQGYNKYYFIVSDKMCDGLTFESIDSIKVGDTTLTADDYDVEQPGANGETFRIIFKNFIRFADQKDSPIVVKYHATLNEGCDRTQVGNPNEVGLTFSNDPNHTYTGEDTPEPEEPMGETPKDSTIVFTTGIKIVKIDAVTKKPLPGATFKIVGEDGVMNKVIVSVAEKFVANDSGTYYLLKNGTYTKAEPTDKTRALYNEADPDQKYKKVEEKAANTEVMDGSSAGIIATVDDNGILTFSGLGAGTYTITEEQQPEGYNKLEDPITLTLTANPAQDDDGVWNPNWNGSPTDGEFVIEQQIENKKDILLPETGGIGTVIFYVVGSLLIGAAVVLFVTKRKKETTDK